MSESKSDFIEHEVTMYDAIFREKPKAQGALEYLMNYGWLVVIIIVIGTTLWYLGIFDTQESAISYQGYTRIQPLVESVIFTTDGDFAAKFANGAGTVIIVNNITVVNSDGTKCHCIINGSNVIQPGKAFKMGGTACSADHYVGDRFVIHLTINYTANVAGMDVERVENGTIIGVYGGAITDIIPADSNMQGCLELGLYWLSGGWYCEGGNDCPSPLKPDCCGDDPGEHYKYQLPEEGQNPVCCAHGSSCASFAASHDCWGEGTPGTTAGGSNIHLCDDGGWLECDLTIECTAKHGYTCTWDGGTWLWRASSLIEESVAKGNCADGKDNDCDGTTDCEPGLEDPDCTC